jgi:acyl-coenzyme A thioesterase PaaI-like protein
MILPTIRRFVLLLAFLPATVVAALPAGVTQGPSVEGVDEYRLSNGLTTTIESSTRFLRGAAVGSTVSAECTAFHKGRTTMVWQTLVKSADGKLCAVVTQTQLVLPA